MYKLLFLLLIFFNFSILIAQNTNVAAHPDDWQLFMNPNTYTDLKSPDEKVIFLHTTAGDDGEGTETNYYLGFPQKV